MATSEMPVFADADALSCDQQPSTWVESVPIHIRRLRAAIAAAIALALAGLLAWAQLASGVMWRAESLWPLALLAVGGFVSYGLLLSDTVRKYARVQVALTIGERFRRLWVFWLIGYVGPALIWSVQYQYGTLSQDWLAGIPFLGVGLVGSLIFVLVHTRWRLTPEAIKMKAYYDVHPAVEAVLKVSAETETRNAKIEKFLERRTVRYPLAVAGLTLACYLAFEAKTLAGWAVVVGVASFSILCVQDVFERVVYIAVVGGLWVLGLAIAGAVAWAIFAGMAALPISAAIVVGAIIIAIAVKR